MDFTDVNLNYLIFLEKAPWEKVPFFAKFQIDQHLISIETYILLYNKIKKLIVK